MSFSVIRARESDGRVSFLKERGGTTQDKHGAARVYGDLRVFSDLSAQIEQMKRAFHEHGGASAFPRRFDLIPVA